MSRTYPEKIRGPRTGRFAEGVETAFLYVFILAVTQVGVGAVLVALTLVGQGHDATVKGSCAYLGGATMVGMVAVILAGIARGRTPLSQFVTWLIPEAALKALEDDTYWDRRHD